MGGAFAVHQICAHESDQLKEAVFDFRDLPKHVQDQISDQSNRDLNTDGILRAADEVGKNSSICQRRL